MEHLPTELFTHFVDSVVSLIYISLTCKCLFRVRSLLVRHSRAHAADKSAEFSFKDDIYRVGPRFTGVIGDGRPTVVYAAELELLRRTLVRDAWFILDEIGGTAAVLYSATPELLKIYCLSRGFRYYGECKRIEPRDACGARYFQKSRKHHPYCVTRGRSALNLSPDGRVYVSYLGVFSSDLLPDDIRMCDNHPVYQVQYIKNILGQERIYNWTGWQ